MATEDEKVTGDTGELRAIQPSLRIRSPVNLFAAALSPGIATMVPGLTPPQIPRSPDQGAFDDLPRPQPGDRIRADDYNRFADALKQIQDVYRLSSALFGRAYGEARGVLLSQGYEIHQVMSVFGNLLNNPGDPSFNERKIVHVAPVGLGQKSVVVVVSEVGETRRMAPNLIGKTYAEASKIMRQVLGDAEYHGPAPSTPHLIGRPLANVEQKSHE